MLDIKRREFITLLGGAAMLAPLTASPQEAGRTYHIGVLTTQSRGAAIYVAFFDELRQLGFVEGQNLIVDGRGFGSRNEQYPKLAAELAKSGIDAFVCGGDAAIRAAQQATRTIPILGQTDDMVGSGLVRSLARPGGNTTGISLLATEFDGKRLEILMEMVPGARRMAAGLTENDSEGQLRMAAFRRGLQNLGWIEERNVHIEERWPGGNNERLRSFTREDAAGCYFRRQ